jgi:malate dehydrogenase (oxaloacetate-decarboxylating)
VKKRFEATATGGYVVHVAERGQAVLMNGLVNRGTVFTEEQRSELGLHGLLPSRVCTDEEQVRRAYENIARKPDALERYIGLAALQDRNETLYYRVLSRHLPELMPVVYTPTVGLAAQRYSHIFRRGRGIWITPADRGRIDELLGNARNEDVRLIVATDNERILGLGDQGAGGMVIPIGKLALYSAVAGIHPAFTLPVSLDIGTDNPSLLADPLYVGWREPRLRGDPYYALLDEFVDAVVSRFPHALLQWEDFKKGNAFGVLARYRGRVTSFNDDIQGTAAVALAGLLAAGRCTKMDFATQRVVILGAGAAGVGIATQLLHALSEAGLTGRELRTAVALVDSAGLLAMSRPNIESYKAPLAWTDDDLADRGLQGGEDLTTVIDALQPTALIGTSGQAGAFDELVVKTMTSHCERPAIFPFSNPTEKAEATPEAITEWSGGRALIATGSPFPTVYHDGRQIPVRQGNNVYIFPGVGLGTLVAGSRAVSDAMFTAAAHALASCVTDADAHRGALYPPVEELWNVTGRIASAVVRAARDEGVGRAFDDDQIDHAVANARWDFAYPTLVPE